jgi:outer membrane protein assembly factor BamD (BamD/ComL family)
MKAVIAVLAFVTIGAMASASAVRQHDSTSCNLYNTGTNEMRQGNSAAAIQTFNRVIDGCQQVDVQATAWLQIGRIRLSQWPVDLAGARTAADRLTGSPYLNTPSAADGFILKGLVELADGRNFADAITEFKRVDRNVTRLTTAIAEAQYRIGEAQRLNHQTEAALRTFQDVTLAYPRTEWAARALVSAAACQTRLGDFRSAMESLQRVRRDFQASPERDLALQRNTILYRLYLKGKSQDLVPVMASRKRYRDGVALAIDRQGRILLGHRDGLAILHGESGDEVEAAALTATTAFGVTDVGTWGDVAALTRERLIVRHMANLPPMRPVSPKPDGVADEVEVLSFTVNWRGEWLIGDGKTNTLRKYTSNGTPAGVLPGRMKAERMAQNDIDDVAVLDGDRKVVWILGRDGAVADQIAKRGRDKEYDFGSPVDVDFDILGNVYVLDGDKNGIFVFDPRLRFRTLLNLPPQVIRKPVALAVDARGYIYVFDRDAQQVFGYQ